MPTATPRRRRPLASPVVDGRHARVDVETASEVERDSEVTCPEGEAKMTLLAERPMTLLERVHRERPRSREPELVFGQLIELQERIPVPRCPVTESGAFCEWSCAPDQLARGKRELGGHEVADRCDETRRTVAPLHADLVPAVIFQRRPVREAVLTQHSSLERPSDALAESV